MYLRVSLTDRCNLRCRYCLPEHARFAPERASTDELLRLTSLVCAEARVTKLRYTGGEPTLCPDLLTHVAHGAALVDGNVGLTSNGVTLAPLLAPLQHAGLRRLNISLDAPDAAGFAAITRRSEFAAVLASIRHARELGFAPLKVNAVALPETNYAGLLQLACREGFHLRFIEVMAIGIARANHTADYVSAMTIRERLFDAGFSLLEATERDEPTARVWVVPDCDPRTTTVGFITTSSDPFCATCDRLRLTSQGHLHNCLFDPRGVDLLTPLRVGDEATARERIRAHVAAKAPPAHFIRDAAMAAIGG